MLFFVKRFQAKYFCFYNTSGITLKNSIFEHYKNIEQIIVFKTTLYVQFLRLNS